MNFADQVLRHSRTNPHLLALIGGSRNISYGQLGLLVRATAARLQSYGVTPGQRVLLCLSDDIDHLVLILASAYLGAVTISLDWRSTADEKVRVAGRFEPVVLLTNRPVPDLEKTRPVKIDAQWRGEVSRATIGSDRAAPGWDRPMSITMSSGSTGEPRGLVMTHGQWFCRSVAYRLSLGLGDGHRYLSALPVSFTMGKEHALHHLLTGNTVITFPHLFSAGEYVEALRRYRVTAAALVPSILRELLALDGNATGLLSGLLSLDVSAAPISAEEKLVCRERLTPHLFVSYGASGAGKITVQPPAHIAERPDSVGRVVAGMLVEVVDQDGRCVPYDTSGEVRCKSGSNATGFTGDVDESPGHERFCDGWYYPGEIASMAPDGSLYLAGRSSNRIVRGGLSYFPEEVERVLEAHPAVREAAVVICREGPPDDETAVYAVVRAPATEDELLRYLKERLAWYKVPLACHFTASLPRTSSGKIARARLKSLAANVDGLM